MKGNAGTQRTEGRHRRKPSRLLVARRRRNARKAEAYIALYVFPTHISARVRRRSQLDEADWKLVEQGLREWFVCCAWRGRTILGMPSRLVDEAWHEFILDSLSYTRFCNVAFGGYLHHTPDEGMSTPMGDALGDTVRAWDRSEMGSSEESVLWDLDEILGAAEPIGVNGLQLSASRSRSTYPLAGGWACAGGLGGGFEGSPGHHGGGHGGGGCSGSGCSGGGCGGGGCGGGS
jgi:uncharacterized membrane protein YgcG